jgi:serine protease inhibitor
MDCHLATMQGKNSEMQFHGELRGRVHTLPSIVWTGQFLVGYDTGLDATAVEIPHSKSPGGAQISTVFIMPGRPEARGSTPLLARLEARLISRRAWSGLLRNLMRTKSVIEVQIPRFEHRSVLNMTVPLRRMGLRDLFAEGRADLRGVNGIQDLYLTDVMQV